MARIHRRNRTPVPQRALIAGILAAGALMVAVTAASCSSSSPGGSAQSPATTKPADYPLDGKLRLNQIQALGSHNSYHIEPAADLSAGLNGIIPGLTKAWEYTHAPLGEQFAKSGVRQIELDVWADPEGGRWADHHVNPMLGKPLRTDDPDMTKPGFKIQHVQELDFSVTCPTLVRCLEQVRTWSDANPGHVPIAILIEAKDSPPIPDPLNMGFVQPLPINGPELDAIDAEIRSVFTDDKLVTPDKVRGSKATLEEAVLSGSGWPTLGEARGKVMFLLDNGDKRQAYAEGHPSLKGRVMFTDAEPGEPEAAFVKLNDAVPDKDKITSLAKSGYVVRTRSDSDTKEARSGDTSVRDAALASGAQWVSTDYEVADSKFGTGFVVAIPGGTPARCNPVNAPPECKPTDIENPAFLK